MTKQKIQTEDVDLKKILVCDSIYYLLTHFFLSDVY